MEGKKNRKIRTTITKEKLAEMNRIFGEYMAHKDDGKNPRYNLKEIGVQLQLGYSTILHKYREYRANKKVKGGALIASLQKKRKYRKSVEIERIIELALADRAFFTAVELSNYIYARYGRMFSRSIISRHLGEMGYSYKNLKSTPMEKNKQKYKDCRQQYALIMN
jgi:transposase